MRNQFEATKEGFSPILNENQFGTTSSGARSILRWKSVREDPKLKFQAEIFETPKQEFLRYSSESKIITLKFLS